MDKIVPSFYKRYGNYINRSRAFPSSVDGLKPVERRVLLSVYDIARDRSVKSFKIDGHWNEKGHDLAAIKLYEYLINEGLT